MYRRSHGVYYTSEGGEASSLPGVYNQTQMTYERNVWYYRTAWQSVHWALHLYKALSSMVQGKMTAASEICITCYQTWLTKCPPLKAETWQKETSVLIKETGCRSTTLLEITFDSLSIQALNSMINGKAHPEKKILAQFTLYSCHSSRTWLSLDLSLLKLCDNLSCNLLKILSNLIYAYAYSNIHFMVLLHQHKMPLVVQLFVTDFNVSFECFELSVSTNDTSKQKHSYNMASEDSRYTVVKYQVLT